MKTVTTSKNLGVKAADSYSQILRSSSIIGGAQGLNYLIGMVRTKLVAVLLGPSGVGLVGLYVTAINLVGVFSGLGIGSSGVRDVAEAHASGDQKRVAHTVQTLRRASWVTGLLGWLFTIALAYPLGLWVFGSGERALVLLILGSTLLIGAVSSGQTALLQGTRRIGQLARRNVMSVLVGTIVSIALYAWLGVKGIVPVLIASALVNLGFSWWFARRITLVPIEQTWVETWHHSKRLIELGLSFMWSGLLGAVVALVTRSWIVKELGLEANGVYQAAWGVSGMFAGFILGAMGTDFFPRLTAVANDNEEVNRLVNEQTEIGILLALPGLLATLIFAPWVMSVFYSPKFLPGAELLPWFILGIFGRVVSWPMGFILLAKGESRWYAATESAANILLLGMTLLLLKSLGLWGVALAFALLYSVYCAGMLCLVRHLSGFFWSGSALRLLSQGGVLITAAFATQMWLPGPAGIALGSILTALASFISLRGIATRLGSNHRLIQTICRIPGGRFACGV